MDQIGLAGAQPLRGFPGLFHAEVAEGGGFAQGIEKQVFHTGQAGFGLGGEGADVGGPSDIADAVDRALHTAVRAVVAGYGYAVDGECVGQEVGQQYGAVPELAGRQKGVAVAVVQGGEGGGVAVYRYRGF